jgi:hypothetical protein
MIATLAENKNSLKKYIWCCYTEGCAQEGEGKSVWAGLHWLGDRSIGAGLCSYFWGWYKMEPTSWA